MSSLSHIIDILISRCETIEDRRTLLRQALGLRSPLLKDISWEGAPHAFVVNILGVLGRDPNALDAVLDLVKEQLDADTATELDNLRPSLRNWAMLGANDIVFDNPSAIRVFLSYARADDTAQNNDPSKSFMRRLYIALTNMGYQVWWDIVSMPSRGLSFTHEIREAVNSCDRLVLVVSPHALTSEYVKAEWQYARSICKPITPVLRIGNYTNIPLELSAIHTPDARDTRSFPDFINELNRVLRDAPPNLGHLYGVPALPSWYVERTDVVSSLVARICVDTGTTKPVVITGKHQVITLHGMPGIGKSVLVSAISRDCLIRSSFPDGIFWVPIGRSPLLVSRMGDIGSAFGDNFEEYVDIDRARMRLSAKLENRAVLLILDDVWDHRHVEVFQVIGSRSRIVVTTRHPQIANLLGGAIQLLDIMSNDEGLKLIAKRLDITANDLPQICLQIVEFLDGHTLSIAIAAGQLLERGLDYAPNLLRRMEERRTEDNPFSDLALDKEDKNNNLAISLSISYEEMSETLQLLFRQTGIFAADSTFDREAAAQVWGISNFDDVEDSLYALMRRGLITRDGNYWRRHNLLQIYARALLRNLSEYQFTLSRYIKWVISNAQQFDQLPPQQWDKLKPLLSHVTEVGNVLSMTWTNTPIQDSELIYQTSDFAYTITNYVFKRPQMIEGIDGPERLGLRWLEIGLAASHRLHDRNREAIFYRAIGNVWFDFGEQHRAFAYYEKSLALSREIGDKSSEATTLNNIGTAWSALGDKRRARDYFEQALSLRKFSDKSSLAATLTNLAAALSGLGEQRRALEHLDRGISLYREIGDQDGEASALHNIGKIWSDLGEKSRALEYYQQALSLRRTVGDQVGEAATLTNIGGVKDDMGEKQEALVFYELSLPLRRAVGDRGGEAATLNNIGVLWDSLGENLRAIEFYEQALALCRAIGDQVSEAITLNNIGLALSSLGQRQKALEYYLLALPVQFKLGDRAGEAVTCFNIGSLYEELGDLNEAVTFIKRCVQLEKEIEHPDYEADKQMLEHLLDRMSPN